MTAEHSKTGMPGSVASGETSGEQPAASPAELYRTTTERLVAVYADRFPLDATHLAQSQLEGRTKIGVAPRPTGAVRPHITEATERYSRLEGQPLGRVMIDSVANTVLTLQDDGEVGGHQQSWRQKYDTQTGLPGELEGETMQPLNAEQTLGALTRIAERVLVLTVDVPQATLEEARQALMAFEPPTEPSAPPNPSA